MARGALLVALLALVIAAITLSSPELRCRARTPLERLHVLRPYQESARYLEILERHWRENGTLASPCVALLGDSLTEGFPTRLTQLRGWSVRGISGDRVRHLAARIESAALGTPCAAVSVLGGTTDVVNDGASPEQVTAEIESLAARLQAAGRRVVITTLPPVRGRYSAANGPIRALNDRIRTLADRGFTIIDLHRELVDERGELAPTFSADGLHLTNAAYERWADALDAALQGAEP